MTFARVLISILLSLSFVACGDASDESTLCLDDQACTSELMMDPNSFAEDHGIIPEVTPENIQRQAGGEPFTVKLICKKYLMEGSSQDANEVIPDVTPHEVGNLEIEEDSDSTEEIEVECNTAAEAVIRDCTDARRSTDQCERQGLWVYAGCKLDLIESN